MLRTGPDRVARSREVRRILFLVLLLNLVVVGLKVVAWLLSDALSVLAEVTHSSLDALNNVFALAFASVAARAPDDRHPYGHYKFETLGALVLVGFLSITVFELGRGAITRLLDPATLTVSADPVAMAILVLSVVVGLAVSSYERRRGRELGSDLLLADAAHTRSDVLAALAVLGGLVAVRFGYPRADPVITLAVAVLIGRTGWKVVRETVPVLVDERAVEERAVRELAETTPGVVSCYGARSRGRPGEVFAELTITVSPELGVSEAHEIADRVERRVAERLSAREVTVHVEPSR